MLCSEQVIAGLDRASATMKKGELAMVTINHEYGFGSVEVEQDLAIVPPCSDLIYEVEMLDFIKVMEESVIFFFFLVGLKNDIFLWTFSFVY